MTPPTRTKAPRRAKKRATKRSTSTKKRRARATEPAEPATDSPRQKYPLEEQWSPALVTDGHTRIANSFLRRYSQLQFPLTTSEAMFVVHLMSFKWGAAKPYPSLKTIAKRMGVTDTAVRKTARKLEQKGYLHRTMRTGETNEFELKPLFRALEAIASDPADDDRKKA